MKRPFVLERRGARKQRSYTPEIDDDLSSLDEVAEPDFADDLRSNNMHHDEEVPDDIFDGKNIDMIYMQEAGKIPVLTRVQEVTRAKKIEATVRRRRNVRSRLSAAQSELASLKNKRLKSARERVSVLKESIACLLQEEAEVETAITEARNAFVVHNLRLVAKIAGKYLYRGLAFSDLVQEGNIGLMKAAEKFNWHLGYKFSTYATWWIRQSMSRAIIESGRTIRIPVNIYDRIPHVLAVCDKVWEEKHHVATPEEIAQATGYPVNKVELALLAAHRVLSLEDISIQHGEPCEYIIRDETYCIESSLVDRRRKEGVKRVLEQALSERACDIVKQRFGLDQYESGGEKVLEEVGKDYDVSRERIRQIEEKALKTLKHPKWSRELKKYLPSKQ
ncbi:MAG: sigma-70 family RNA polymerase sigma factor [bacterium]|nr:sigma-70 family RNA polymerase sigma factor [bacterium]